MPGELGLLVTGESFEEPAPETEPEEVPPTDPEPDPIDEDTTEG
jgi:hypothetical protein